MLKVKKITAKSVNPKTLIRLEMDGEYVGQLPVTFELKAKKILVRCPK
jgi:diacylglycerol kinase family enzyme